MTPSLLFVLGEPFFFSRPITGSNLMYSFNYVLLCPPLLEEMRDGFLTLLPMSLFPWKETVVPSFLIFT